MISKEEFMKAVIVLMDENSLPVEKTEAVGKLNELFVFSEKAEKRIRKAADLLAGVEKDSCYYCPVNDGCVVKGQQHGHFPEQPGFRECNSDDYYSFLMEDMFLSQEDKTQNQNETVFAAREKLLSRIRENSSLNRYALTPDGIRNLKFDRSKITDHDFWYNGSVNAWCLSGSVGDASFCDETEYWLGIYDDDARENAGQIRLEFYAGGGMLGYNLTRFFEPEEIDTQDDLEIQIVFIKRINDLIDRGIFIIE